MTLLSMLCPPRTLLLPLSLRFVFVLAPSHCACHLTSLSLAFLNCRDICPRDVLLCVTIVCVDLVGAVLAGLNRPL